jgi:hypothetical protein
MKGFPFRVIVTAKDGQTAQVVTLPRAPDIGDQLELPDGEKIRVSRVLSADAHTVSGVVLAEPDSRAESRAADDERDGCSPVLT